MNLNEWIAGDQRCDFAPFDVHDSGGPWELHRPVYLCAYCELVVVRCWRAGSWIWCVPPIFEESP